MPIVGKAEYLNPCLQNITDEDKDNPLPRLDHIHQASRWEKMRLAKRKKRGQVRVCGSFQWVLTLILCTTSSFTITHGYHA
ncbi:uncharacterized protein LY89DRAFT_243379 [Mollisia scopiformis]|uniref:Uncharacterized protein n=1 Tax=Mollisia scopiformis TaxID=149040 RepID=A0A194WTU1_MOLSC|nr:uncharacterized protein LY89DRAFT_243379 [Mollisia scopiformis]KUJ11378.1 hypothetical protein LY89DRAFT_243379 [Mollisia scopiformis]